jgi:hypothetical protein
MKYDKLRMEVAAMCDEVEAALAATSQPGRVVQGRIERGRFFQADLSFPLHPRVRGRVLVELMIAHPGISWEVQESKIIARPSGANVVNLEHNGRLHFVAPTPIGNVYSV